MGSVRAAYVLAREARERERENILRCFHCGAVFKPVPSQPFARRRPFRKRLQATDAFDCHLVPADLSSKREMMDLEEQWLDT